ncbi:hypothetical protein KY345_00440 [Candidatus Woesearchaeota archaeon]|nr:hypothetical protein [Candidatus Woesearchaeota archaeon]
MEFPITEQTIEDTLIETRPDITEELLKEIKINLRKENIIRVVKRLNDPCPLNKDGYCSDISFRCAERQQYPAKDDDHISYRETDEDKLKLHRCNYSPFDNNMHAIVLAYFKETAGLYPVILDEFGFKGKIHELSALEEIEETLNQLKINNRQLGLVILDAESDNFRALNLLVEKNSNSRIIAVFPTHSYDIPPGYSGEEEIIPGRRVASEVEKSGSSFWMSELVRIVGEQMQSYRERPYS